MYNRILRNRKSCSKRQGFTLIEVLTVIAIIGILVGLLLPAIGAVRRSMSNAAMKFEVANIDMSVAAYKTKYGDFPPDGSDLPTLTRHLRKVFPSISQSEIALFSSTFPGSTNRLFTFSNNAPGGVMDPPEALVFFLGGFSDDPVFPISGVGGPVFITQNGVQITSDKYSPGGDNMAIQYNPTRNSPIHDFGNGSLSVEVVELNGVQYTLSTDEGTLFGAPGGNDLVPTYSFSRSVGPICYFDSRTYSKTVGSTGDQRFYNHYAPSGGGVCRPYKSADINTTIPHTDVADPAAVPAAVIENNDLHFRYVNPESFQLVAAGLDENYGGLPQGQDDAVPVFYSYPSGEQMNILAPGGGSGFSRYTEVSGQPSAQLDNITNFADSTLENSIDG
ncbi:MAG: type II secretion system protein [Planctomycetota bacterium]